MKTLLFFLLCGLLFLVGLYFYRGSGRTHGSFELEREIERIQAIIEQELLKPDVASHYDAPRYAVWKGGCYDRENHSHIVFAGFNLATARDRVILNTQRLFVQYRHPRLGVQWTKKSIAVPAGTQILEDSEGHMVLKRCCNGAVPPPERPPSAFLPPVIWLDQPPVSTPPPPPLFPLPPTEISVPPTTMVAPPPDFGFSLSPPIQTGLPRQPASNEVVTPVEEPSSFTYVLMGILLVGIIVCIWRIKSDR
ncbi:MAG: hypothetical protein HY617_00690 [Candidatus Sungbacteria bacterium]|nr:hypothetical protein [Candidatus Sungbacteria bacterium]